MTTKSNNDALILGATGTSVAGASLILSISALAITLENRNNIDVLTDNVNELDVTHVTLVNDGSHVANSFSILGVPPTSGAGTTAVSLHFKSLTEGNQINIVDQGTNLVIESTLAVLLTANPSTTGVPFSLVASGNAPNFPVVRNLKAGAGVTLTIDSDGDIVISV